LLGNNDRTCLGAVAFDEYDVLPVTEHEAAFGVRNRNVGSYEAGEHVVWRVGRVVQVPPVNIGYKAVDKIEKVEVCTGVKIHRGNSCSCVLYKDIQRTTSLRGHDLRDFARDVNDFTLLLGRYVQLFHTLIILLLERLR
jgi:hypothetical protein